MHLPGRGQWAWMGICSFLVMMRLPPPNRHDGFLTMALSTTTFGPFNVVAPVLFPPLLLCPRCRPFTALFCPFASHRPSIYDPATHQYCKTTMSSSSSATVRQNVPVSPSIFAKGLSGLSLRCPPRLESDFAQAAPDRTAFSLVPF